MASLNRFVTVNVSTATAQIKQPGFGTVLIMGSHSRFSERIRFFSETSAMLTDGFLTTDPEYKAAVKLLSQNPRVTRFAVGRRALKETLAFDITPSAVNSKLYRITVNGVDKDFTSDASATVAEICTGLVAALGTITGFTVTDATTKVTVVASAAGNWVGLKANDPALLKVAQVQADPGIATDLAAANTENPDWYGVTMTTHSKAELVAAAAWVEANGKLMVQPTQDSDVIQTAASGATDVAATLKGSSYKRTGLIYHPDNSDFAGAAWMGRCFPKSPGSLTFKFKSLSGVASVTLTDTQLGNAEDKNCNVYTDFGGTPFTSQGVTAQGEFLDVTRDTDWFTSRLQVRVATLKLANDKISFDDGGIALLEGELRNQVEEGITAKFLAASPAPIYIVPLASAVASADKAVRTLTGLQAQATIAGAIHSTTLAVTLTL